MLFFFLCIRKHFFIIYIFWAQFYRLSPLVSLPRHPKLKVKYNVIKDKASCFPFSRKVKEFYHTRVSRSVCHVFALWALRSFVLLFKVLWSAAPVLMFAAQMQSGPDWNGGGQEERKRGASDRVSGRDGGGGKESLQGKWMVGMCGEAQWMSCTLGWGGLQVLCWGSRSQSGCDWHQKQHFMAGNTVAGRRRASRTFSINRLISYAVVEVFVLRALKEHDSLTKTLLQLITVYRWWASWWRCPTIFTGKHMSLVLQIFSIYTTENDFSALSNPFPHISIPPFPPIAAL